MVLCTIVLALSAILLLVTSGSAGRNVQIVKNGSFLKIWKKVLLIVAGAAIFGIMADRYEKQSPLLQKDNSVARYENGEGDYQVDLVLKLENLDEDELKEYGLKRDYRYSVIIPEQALSREEKESFLTAAQKEIEEEFPGNNESVNCIRDRVCIRESYQNGKVTAEWTFSDYKVIDFEGAVIAEELPEKGTLVNAEVTLSCADRVSSYTFPFQVFNKLLNEEEKLFDTLGEELKMQETNVGTNSIKLPEKLGEYSLIWEEERSYLPEKLLLMGILLAAFLPISEQSKVREEHKKREIALALGYPDMVSKLSLLLGAGMTVFGAWKKITGSYLERKKLERSLTSPVYEEMLVTCHEIESGIGEERAYERFGERCGQRRYRKLGNILTQNLKKGTKGLTVMLEAEVDDAFEERKSVARKYGEEAGTKLLGPMVVMLGIVMLILIVPAVFSFQI